MIPAILRRDFVTAGIAVTAVVSKFMPLLLANVPFTMTQTWAAFLVYAWLSVALLGLMILILLAWSLLLRYPYFPVDPGTLIGGIYYTCDSYMVQDFQSLPGSSEKERRRRIREMGRTYRFGKMVGVSDSVRVGVDYADGAETNPSQRTVPSTTEHRL